MKQLSYWGRDHKAAARTLIIICYVILNIAGLFIGDLLYGMGVVFKDSLYLILSGLTVIALLLYPRHKNKQEYSLMYVRRKMVDGLLVLTTFLFIIFAGNRINRDFSFLGNTAQAAAIVPSHVAETPATTTTLSKKEKRKSIRAWIKNLRKTYKEQGQGAQTVMIILVVLGALLAGYLMVGLACHVACTASEALGWIVGIVGVSAIIFGAVKLIQSIVRKGNRNDVSRKPMSGQPLG